MPGIGDWTSENLDPEFLRVIRVKLSEGTGNASKGIDLEVIKCFDWQGGIFRETELSGINNLMRVAVIDIIFVDSIDLYGWVLSVNLALHETLLGFWGPNIKADLSTSTNHFKAEMFLDAARALKRFCIT